MSGRAVRSWSSWLLLAGCSTLAPEPSPQECRNDADCNVAGEVCAPDTNVCVPGEQLPPVADLGFDVTVRNNGPATATGTVLTAVLTGISSANVITAPSGCAVSGATVSCTLANLGKGAKVRRTISVVPDTAGTVRLSAAATSAAPDPNAANSSAVASASVR